MKQKPKSSFTNMKVVTVQTPSMKIQEHADWDRHYPVPSLDAHWMTMLAKTPGLPTTHTPGTVHGAMHEYSGNLTDGGRMIQLTLEEMIAMHDSELFMTREEEIGYDSIEEDTPEEGVK